MTTAPSGLLLSDDLLFISRIVGTAEALALPLRAVRSMALLLAQAKQAPPVCVLVDLANPGLDIDQLVQALTSGQEQQPTIVAYGAHVDTATLRRARAAGCALVLPRSKFVEELPTALPAWWQGTVS